MQSNSNNILFKSVISEYATVSEDSSGITTEKVEMEFYAAIGGVRIDSGTFVQIYAQFEDEIRATGIYDSFTCNTVFERNDEYAETKQVNSFLGSTLLSNSTDMKWDQIAFSDQLQGDERTWTLTYG